MGGGGGGGAGKSTEVNNYNSLILIAVRFQEHHQTLAL